MNDLRSRLTQGDSAPPRRRVVHGRVTASARAAPRGEASFLRVQSRLVLPIAAMLLFVAVGTAWLVRNIGPHAGAGIQSRPGRGNCNSQPPAGPG
jgi:hypothetical protein